jgi:protein-S-isoprenylcysteine O-methyltransferase Ste14
MIDLPPVWLGASILVVWGFDQVLPWGMFGPLGRPLGAALVLLGLALMVLAVVQMQLSRTTVMPRRDPNALVRGGAFGLSRNPIYLGDVLVLAGAVLFWDVPVATPVILAFMALIQHRFILGEEARLSRLFGAEFDSYKAQVNRWVGRSRYKLPQSRN